MKKKLIAKNTYLLSDFDMCCMYLVIGEKRALLIDTGLGYKGLRENVESLIGDLPIDVVLTHGHVDHIGGASQFDKVYMHDADLELIPKMKKSERIKFITENFLMNPLLLKDFTKVYKIKKEKKASFVSLEDGQVFDLGGRKLTFYHTPGHTKGSGMFFDSETKILFSGDTVSPYAMIMFPESADVKTYADSLKTVKKLSKSASKLYGGHSFITPAKPKVLRNLRKITKHIEGENGVKFAFRLFPLTSLIYK